MENVITCPYCGEELEFDQYGIHCECGWFLPEEEFEDVFDKETLVKFGYFDD